MEGLKEFKESLNLKAIEGHKELKGPEEPKGPKEYKDYKGKEYIEDKEIYKAEGTLAELCKRIQCRVKEGRYSEGRVLIIEALEAFPESAIPHNLMGILLEKERKHIQAMKHFRAAYALEPSYEPARHNMELFGGLYPAGQESYLAADCKKAEINFKKQSNKRKQKFLHQLIIGEGNGMI